MAAAKSNQQHQPNSVSLQVAKGFSGPVPPPDLLAGYESVLPGSAERIIRMAETEQSHRHGREQSQDQLQEAFQRNIAREVTTGQICALLIGIIAIVSGAYAAVNGAQWTGSFIGGGGVIGLVTAFLVGRKRPSP
jgi:uncharacterized membrane protein